MKRKNKNKSLLHRFFSHNITLLVMAFILAFVGWFVISMNDESEETKTITDVPVAIELPEAAADDGLKLYGADDLKVSVEVSGNRVTLGSLTASDLQVTANQSSSMNSPGSYTLSLSAKQGGVKTNYTVEKVTPSTITVYVDREKQEEYTIDNQITVKLSESNHYASVALSNSKVIVSGPETQVSQIASVAVIDTITGDEQKTVTEKLTFLDENGNKLELPYVTTDTDTIDATISVLPVAEVSLKVDVTNEPSDYPEITLDPSTVKIAGPQETLDKIEDNTVSIGTLDFTKLKNEKYKLKLDITLSKGCKVISGESTTNAYIDLSSYDSTTVTAKIASKLDSTDYTTEFASNNVDVTVMGPEDKIDEISASDLTVIADFTGLLDKLESGKSISVSAPLKITLSNDYTDCWIYDSYTVNVTVTKK